MKPVAVQAKTESITPPDARGPFNIGIRGMSCASCVRRVEKAIQAVPGVAGVSVNLATEQARITVAEGEFDLTAALKAIEEAGYQPVSETVDLQIEGMSCASCVGRIERTLTRKLPGVLEAKVNLATGRARVRYLAGLRRTGHGPLQCLRAEQCVTPAWFPPADVGGGGKQGIPDRSSSSRYSPRRTQDITQANKV